MTTTTTAVDLLAQVPRFESGKVICGIVEGGVRHSTDNQPVDCSTTSRGGGGQVPPLVVCTDGTIRRLQQHCHSTMSSRRSNQVDMDTVVADDVAARAFTTLYLRPVRHESLAQRISELAQRHGMNKTASDDDSSVKQEKEEDELGAPMVEGDEVPTATTTANGGGGGATTIAGYSVLDVPTLQIPRLARYLLPRKHRDRPVRGVAQEKVTSSVLEKAKESPEDHKPLASTNIASVDNGGGSRTAEEQEAEDFLAAWRAAKAQKRANAKTMKQEAVDAAPLKTSTVVGSGAGACTASEAATSVKKMEEGEEEKEEEEVLDAAVRRSIPHATCSGRVHWSSVGTWRPTVLRLETRRRGRKVDPQVLQMAAPRSRRSAFSAMPMPSAVGGAPSSSSGGPSHKLSSSCSAAAAVSVQQRGGACDDAVTAAGLDQMRIRIPIRLRPCPLFRSYRSPSAVVHLLAGSGPTSLRQLLLQDGSSSVPSSTPCPPLQLDSPVETAAFVRKCLVKSLHNSISRFVRRRLVLLVRCKRLWQFERPQDIMEELKHLLEEYRRVPDPSLLIQFGRQHRLLHPAIVSTAKDADGEISELLFLPKIRLHEVDRLPFPSADYQHSWFWNRVVFRSLRTEDGDGLVVALREVRHYIEVVGSTPHARDIGTMLIKPEWVEHF